MADQLLRELGISDGVTLRLNTLGDAETRDAWRAGLVAHFEAHRDWLSKESLDRLGKNPLRILDSKDEGDREVAAAAPDIDAFLTPDARAFFDAVTAGLDAAGVAWTRDARLVRGLDYYRHTAFEFVTDRLGAQGTVLAGGRYDGLVESLGGPPTPGVGWAAGVERLAMLVTEPSVEEPQLVIVPVSDDMLPISQRVLNAARRRGTPADMAFKGSLKKRLARASATGALAAVIIGPDEIARGEVVLRIMEGGHQFTVPLESMLQDVVIMDGKIASVDDPNDEFGWTVYHDLNAAPAGGDQ